MNYKMLIRNYYKMINNYVKTSDKKIENSRYHQMKSSLQNDMTKKILKISDKRSIELACEKLDNGDVIALPTDTIYGLACNANCPNSIENLYSIKERNHNKPLAICVGNIKNLRYYGNAEHLSDDILNKLLPGPFTIILNKTNNLNNPYLNNGIIKIGIRIPKYKFIQELCEKFNKPLALTSANKSNEKSSLKIDEFKYLWPKLSLIFDGGKLSLNDENRSGSTVIDLSEIGKCKIIRKGVAYLKTLEVMKEYGIIIE